MAGTACHQCRTQLAAQAWPMCSVRGLPAAPLLRTSVRGLPVGYTSRVQQQNSLSKKRTCQAPHRAAAVEAPVASFADDQDQSSSVPKGYVWYETMLVLRPDMTDDERDTQLAKFETFLSKEDAVGVEARIRGRQQLAYPMKGYWEGIYVLYRYACKRKTTPEIQKLLSKPLVGTESSVLRHVTFRLAQV